MQLIFFSDHTNLLFSLSSSWKLQGNCLYIVISQGQGTDFRWQVFYSFFKVFLALNTSARCILVYVCQLSICYVNEDLKTSIFIRVHLYKVDLSYSTCACTHLSLSVGLFTQLHKVAHWTKCWNQNFLAQCKIEQYYQSASAVVSRFVQSHLMSTVAFYFMARSVFYKYI